jgi:putative colanic acid biosynthesis acetyltransferase WcaF
MDSPGLTGDESERSLRGFTGTGYQRGRKLPWQIAWFAMSNLVFMKWWFPSRLRPTLLRAFGAEVGKRVLIRHRVRIHWPWNLVIGTDCWLGEDVWLINLEQIIIGNDVCISQGAMLCTGSHKHWTRTLEFDNRPIEVQSGAWVATRATILRGVTIGTDALVGAGALVVSNVAPHSKVLGTPGTAYPGVPRLGD